MNDDLIRKTFANCLILEKIGQGGMGVVYKAHSITLNKVVCVKLLSKELEADPRNIDFFLREAEISKQLDHPNTVHIYDYGKEKGNYYIVMSYVEGKSIDQIIKEKGTFTVPQASDIIIGVLRGLEHAHSKNIIHRDIKPSNIIINNEGVPRIIDFGLARRVVEEKQLTITGEMIGTAYFMSPEQGLGKRVDQRADLYSVGATYFYMLTGKYPYDGKTSIEVINKHINDPIPNLYLIKPDLPIWTVKIIEKLMRKNPDDRYQSAKEVREEIEKYKSKNYENIIISSESEYDLDELSKNQTAVQKNNKTTQSESFIGEIEIKKNETVSADKNEEIKNLKSEPQKKTIHPKLQSLFVFKLTKSVHHIFYSMFSFAFLTIFTTINSSESYLSILKSITIKPYSLIFLALGILFAYLFLRTEKITYPLLYFFILFISFITIAFNGINYTPQIQGFMDRLVYIIKSIRFGKDNMFILSFAIVLTSHSLSTQQNSMTLKTISILLLLLSIFMFWKTIAFTLNIDINSRIFYLAISSAIIYGVTHIFIMKKNLIFFIYLILAFYMIIASKDGYINNNSKQQYEQEIARYKKEKEKIALEVRERFYLNLSNIETNSETYDDIEEKIKENIRIEIAKLKEPDINKIRFEVSKKYFKETLLLFYQKYIRHTMPSIFIFWILLNFIFIRGIFKKEEYEI
ncbi:MAG: protein kinase [Elusimicrobiota bacterium]